MKYLGFVLLFFVSISGNAQYLSEDFLSADLENSSFELRGWDGVFSEKEQLALASTWRIGKLINYSEADTTTKDFVIFPARFVAKAGFEGIAITSGEDFKNLAFNQKELVTITEDMPILSMFMLPEKMGLSKVHQLLIKTLENSILVSLKTNKKQANDYQELSFFSFRKSYEKNAIGIHYMILDLEAAEMTDEDFAALSDLKVFQFLNKKQPTKMVADGMIVAYSLPIPRSWKGETRCSLLNTKYGVMYSESFPKSKNPRRLDVKQVQALLIALLEEQSKGLFISRG
ncbi:MAG: hypothetical protein P8N19_11410 [Flavobacteriales bacterium]|nr:hypothetical protein [Flavobacteriales bacterium]